MIPVLYPIKTTWGDEGFQAIQRLQCLEVMLDGMLDVIQTLSRVVDVKVSKDAPNEELDRLIEAISQEAASTLEQEIDQQIKTVSEHRAVRFVRGAMAVTWDDALAITARWNSYSQTERIRMVRFSKLAAFISSNQLDTSCKVLRD